ncbi:hypothetical protein L7F22_013950 [Adiantum nelumboides]|nr:hypothetical protein [Adiantum nelumboides]
MVVGSLLRGSNRTTVPFHPCIAVSKPPCRSLSARPLNPKASCKYFPFVPGNTIDRHDVSCVRSHETSVKHNALVKQGLLASCQRSSFSAQWVEDSISEIVRHIHEALFLLMLVNHEDTSVITLTHRQIVPTGDALSADKKWREVKSHLSEASLDAVILVHKLCDGYIEGYDVKEGLAKPNANVHGKEGRSNGTHLWGVLLLGKAITESACYILETTRVASSFGICTHFCLTKAQSFGPSWSDQIQGSWLLGTER